MLKIRSISFVLIAFLISSITFVLPATAQARDGFLLIGADAAYAWFDAKFEAGYLGECTGELFIGYVKADGLLYFGSRGGPNPHSDVQVIFNGDCGADRVALQGVRGALDHPGAVMIELEAAYLNNFLLTLYDEDSGAAVADVDVTVEWQAIGDMWTETFHTSDSNSVHLIRAADFFPYDVTIGGKQVDFINLNEAVITHYNENNWGSSE
jgi:hypothetical protein